MILLDTCVLLWMASEPDRLSGPARQLLLKNADALFVSSISAFEIAVKARKKKLVLSLDPLRWFQRALEHHGIEEIVLNGELLVQSAQLPLHHNDPCDRIIVATAQIHGLKVLTPDPLIRQYDTQVAW